MPKGNSTSENGHEIQKNAEQPGQIAQAPIQQSQKLLVLSSPTNENQGRIVDNISEKKKPKISETDYAV